MAFLERIIVCDKEGQFFREYDISLSTTKLFQLTKMVERDSNKSVERFQTRNQILSDDARTLKSCGVKAEDVIIATFKENSELQLFEKLEDITSDVYMNPDVFRKCLTSQPHLLQQLFSVCPTLAEAVLSSGLKNLENELTSFVKKGIESSREIQLRLEQQIHRQNIDQSAHHAFQFAPEKFVSTHMLFLPCTIKGHHTEIFVDTGAQRSIISKTLAERFGLIRLLDTRFRGSAVGIGTADVLGRIHATEMKIGSNYFDFTLHVIDTEVGLILGLDMLKMHRMEIDLRKFVMRIAGDEIPFLNEQQRNGNAIKRIVSLGFSEQQAREALSRTQDNVEKAIEDLLAMK